jgi:hypothetical protein
MLGTGPLLGQALQLFVNIWIYLEFCSRVSAQACLLVQIHQNSEMSTAMDRKRSNRALKRMIDKDIISEEEARSQFRRGESSSSKQETKKAEEGIIAEEETKWQYKGEGKGGSLGVTVGSNGIVEADAGDVGDAGDARWIQRGIPLAPKANTTVDVQAMFDTGYYKYPETPFWDGKDIWKVRKGTHCLWKNVPTGKQGGQSTKTEVFHGECHGWQGEEVILS